MVGVKGMAILIDSPVVAWGEECKWSWANHLWRNAEVSRLCRSAI